MPINVILCQIECLTFSLFSKIDLAVVYTRHISAV